MGKRLSRVERDQSAAAPPHGHRTGLLTRFSAGMERMYKLLDGRSLVMLAVTCKWFQVPDPGNVPFKWIELYTTAFDWMRIGGFLFDSPDALLTESLIESIKTPKEGTSEKLVKKEGYCLLNNIKTGIWIADLHLVRRPVCDLGTCDGIMQTLDARHIELFLSEEYRSGSWDYHLLGSHNVYNQADVASAGIFDIKHLNDESTSDIFDLKSWVGKQNDWKQKARITLHTVAVNTNLQDNEGLQIKYHAKGRERRQSRIDSYISAAALSFALSLFIF